MAPSINQTPPLSPPLLPVSYDINLAYKPLTEKEREKYTQPPVIDFKINKYAHYMPVWEPHFFPPCPPFHFIDPALRADSRKPNLLGSKGITVRDLTPKMGSEISGIQLSNMTDAQKDELALLISERKCVVFRDQDFLDLGPHKQQEFMAYFGKPNYQPVTGAVAGYPGFHIIYRDGNQAELDRFFSEKPTSTLWHHDVSYERQPPGYVLLCNVNTPTEGGDTVFASCTEAYK
jgi:sulfonate dioxygenase